VISQKYVCKHKYHDYNILQATYSIMCNKTYMKKA